MTGSTDLYSPEFTRYHFTHCCQCSAVHTHTQWCERA